MLQLESSLKRLKTDYLDLWQVHEVVYPDDPKNHYAKDGVLEALAQAKKDGKVRLVGFTGHKSPDLHLDMLKRGFPFDTVQLPLNPLDGTFQSFERKVLPVLQQRGIAALAMKTMVGNCVRHGSPHGWRVEGRAVGTGVGSRGRGPGRGSFRQAANGLRACAGERR